jgi:hypothetical protein
MNPVIHVGLANPRPARRVEGLEAILEDEGLTGALGEAAGSAPGDGDGLTAGPILEDDLRVVDRTEPAGDLLFEAE